MDRRATRAAAPRDLPSLLRGPRLTRDRHSTGHRGRNCVGNPEHRACRAAALVEGGHAMIDVEPLIVSGLDRLVPLPSGGRADWADVLSRAGAGRRINLTRR